MDKGILGMGGNVIKTKVGKFAEKLKTGLELGQILPGIDKGCEALSKVVGVYI